MTDAIAEELLGPAEDEEGDEIEEEDDSVRGDGHVVAGGATLNASRSCLLYTSPSPRDRG